MAGGRPDRARPRLPGPPADVGGGAGRLDGRRGRDRRAGGGRRPAVRGAGGAAPLLVGAAGPAGGRGGAVAAGAQPDHRLAAAARAPGTAPGPGVAGGHAARGRLGPAGLARLRPPGLAAGPRARGPPSGAVPPGRRRVRRRLVRWLPDRLRPGRRRRPRAGAGVPAEALRPDRHGVGDRAGLAAAVHRRRPRLGRRRAGRGAAPPAPPARAGARGWHLCEGGPQVTPATPRPQPPWRQVLAVGVAGLLAGAVLLGLQFVRLDRNHLGGGPSAPFFVGTAWHLDEELTARNIHVVIRQGKGYDGQWFLGLAYDPLLRGHLADGFDMPRYRARRPLLAMAGWLLAAGQPAAVPAALLAVELLAVGVGCAASARLLAAAGLSRWWGLGFAAAALTKETYLGFAGAAAIWLLLRWGAGLGERVRAAATVLVPGTVLLGAWWWYVGAMVPASRTDQAGLESIAAPFVGWGQTLARIAGGSYVPDAPVGVLGPASLVATFALLVVAVVLTLRARTLLDWTGLVMGIYGLMIAGGQLDRFLSAARALAPCVLGAALGVAAVVALSRSGRIRHDGPGEREAGRDEAVAQS